MERCPHCNGKIEPGVELIIVNGRTIPQKIMKCTKCGKAIVDSEEYERVRKELHPSLLDRIKNLFRTDVELVELFKGKVL